MCRSHYTSAPVLSRPTALPVTAASGDRVPPRLHLLTRNAQPIAEGDRANPAHAVLWGLGSTLAPAPPQVWCGLVDDDAHQHGDADEDHDVFPDDVLLVE